MENVTFKRALAWLPRFITGFDALGHTEVDSLRGLVELQMDLREDGQESDIVTRKQLEACKRYLIRIQSKEQTGAEVTR